MRRQNTGRALNTRNADRQVRGFPPLLRVGQGRGDVASCSITVDTASVTFRDAVGLSCRMRLSAASSSVRRFRLSTASASREKQPVDAVKDVLVLYKFATVGLLDASLHAYDEAGLIFEHPGNSVFHQLLGVIATGTVLHSRIRWRE